MVCAISGTHSFVIPLVWKPIRNPVEGFLDRNGIRRHEADIAKMNMPETPVLWTEKDFGECMMDPIIKLDTFSAVYSAHNMSVSLNLRGATYSTEDDVIGRLTLLAWGDVKD